MPSISDGDFNLTLSELATLIAAYTNPHMFPFDLGEMSAEDIEMELCALKDLMKEMIG